MMALSLSILSRAKFVEFPCRGDIWPNNSNSLNNKWKRKINEGSNEVLGLSVTSHRLFAAIAAT